MEGKELLPKPTKISSVDFSHVFSKEFGELFSSDCVDPEVIEYLRISQGSNDEDHQAFVAELIDVTAEREKAFNEINYLRNHLRSVYEKALRDDEIEDDRIKEFAYLNLPPAESTFFHYIDNDLLKKYGLICPGDIVKETLNIPEKSTVTDTFRSLTHSDEQDSLKIQLKAERRTSLNSTKLPPLERPASTEKGRQQKKNVKAKLIDMRLASDKEDDKFRLALLDAKTNYMKNPRHLFPDMSNESRAWLIHPSKAPDDDKKIFIAEPSIIEFNDYEIGKVYEKLINFRNVTSALRSIRVLPPRTRYFSLGLGQFPGENGLVAAGMCCQYAIKFSPDSVGDYEDEIVVEMQGNQTYHISIIGKRPRPILTGGSVWDIGHCLIYGVKIVHFKIKNIGGDGRFCIIDSSLWPVSNSKILINSGQIIVDPFIIRPNCFELKWNESVTLELIFCPTLLGIQEKELLVLCDNCHSEVVNIQGFSERASVNVDIIDGGMYTPAIDESVDISAQLILKFDDLNPFTFTHKTMVLKNDCHVEIPYCWKIVKPSLKPPFTEINTLNHEIFQNRILDLDSAFFVEPAVGVFPAYSTLSFGIMFAPLEVKSYHSVLHLVLQGVPDIKIEEISGTDNKRQSSPDTKYPDFQSNHSNVQVPVRTINSADITGSEIEVKGSCIPLSVKLSTPSLIIGGGLLINTPVRRQIEIINDSMVPVNISWQGTDAEGYIFEVEPKLCTVMKSGIVDVCLLGNKPGFYRDTLICNVDNLDYPLELFVEAVFKGPDIEICQEDIDFGLVKLGNSVQKTLKMINQSSIKCEWSTRIGGSFDTDILDEIIITPKRGIMIPLQVQEISIQFKPNSVKKVNCGLEINVVHTTSRFLNIRAHVQLPVVVLEESQLCVTDKLFLDVLTTFSVTLCNQSQIDCKYAWQGPFGNQSDILNAIFEPPSGTIPSKEKQTIKVIVTCFQVTEISDLFIPCLIQDLSEPVVLEVHGLCRGPRLICSVLDSVDSKECKTSIDFGNAIPIFQDVKKYIAIENTTSIVTTFSISIDYFKVSSEDVKIEKSKRKPNLADRQSKPDYLAHYDYCKNKLKHKNGLAIDFNPVRKTLQSYEKVFIEVTAFNDMWGSYNDVIRITGTTKTTETETIVIPVSIGVVGLPIEFTMTAGLKDQKPILRLGSKPVGHETVTRRIRLNNKSPYDVYLNWEMYRNTDSKDDKVIDFFVNCGDPFPILSGVTQTKDKIVDSGRSDTRNDVTIDSEISSTARQFTERFLNTDRTDQTDDFERVDFGTKLITTIIRPHEGIKSTFPIDCEPKQLHIAAESFGFVTIHFHPSNPTSEDYFVWDDNAGIDIENYLLGIISLKQKDLSLENKMTRIHQYLIKQIKLDITGRILQPRLQIDYPDSEEHEEISFVVPYSCLLQTDNCFNINKSTKIKKTVVLRNTKDTDIAFSLNIRSPFEIEGEHFKTGSTIAIGEAVIVPIIFTLKKSMLAMIDDESLYANTEAQCLKVDKICLSNSNQRSMKVIQFRDVITVKFKNTNITQYIPLRAQIYCPEVIVNPSTINFQVCLVGDTVTEQFRISNKSNSQSVVLLNLANCPDQIFEVNPTVCHIFGESDNCRENSATVNVSFTPKLAVEYYAEIIIKGMMGEENIVIPLTGRGTYDNQYETKY